MDKINIRYGEDVIIPIDTGDTADVSATLYIGKPGQVYILTTTASLDEGKGFFSLSKTDTEIPLGTYNFQVNVIDDHDRLQKFPQPDKDCYPCENSFPEFIVSEALDVTEVS